MSKKKSTSTESLLAAEAAQVDVTDFKLTLPLYVLLGEAIDVARFCQHYWSAAQDRPGLEQCGRGRLSAKIADEIVTLHELVQKTQTAYLLAIAPPSESTERAEFVLDELASAIEWVCDDGVEDEKDAKLAAIIEAHRGDAASEDALASEIADYLGLATELADDLAELPAFDSAILDEAKGLVLSLRERSAARVRGRSDTSSTLLQQRNQFAALLIQRIARVRSATRYVFRHHDAIVKQVTSAYERRRRAAARKRASEQTAPTTTPVSSLVPELSPTA